jgi:hypothetical protein
VLVVYDNWQRRQLWHWYGVVVYWVFCGIGTSYSLFSSSIDNSEGSPILMCGFDVEYDASSGPPLGSDIARRARRHLPMADCHRQSRDLVIL